VADSPSAQKRADTFSGNFCNGNRAVVEEPGPSQQSSCRQEKSRLRSFVSGSGGSMKTIGILAVALAIAYVAISGALFAAMHEQPEHFARVMSHVPWPVFVVLPFKPLWYRARAGQLIVGDAAPDFVLESTEHQNHFQLSSLKGQKPVVLVFGSYT
jgi:hypothetical protein